MTRTFVAVSLVLGLLCLASTQASAVPLGLAKIGVGAYGITNTPIAQDDNAPSGLFGIKGRVKLLSLLAFEPSWTTFSGGEKTLDDVTNPDGSEIKVNGPDTSMINLNLVWGGLIYGTAGIGWSTLDFGSQLGSTTETTYNFGAGAEIGVAGFTVDLSPRFIVIKTADSGSRKSFQIQAGVNYYFM